MSQATIIERICSQVRQLIQHSNEVKKLTGEDFNIYSILGMEYLENATHSNFLGELLNPTGSHHFGSLFLELFLEETNQQAALHAESASITIEKHIGNIDIKTKTGGRIDIYLEDKNGHSISIENKIYASDQPAQIERYCNHNKGKNTVFYLSLWGNDAHQQSKGDLEGERDYFLISYQENILNWLEACQKEAVNKETVRSGIGHYINLIKKLTNQHMDHQMEKELYTLIRQNYSEVRLMADNMAKVEQIEAYELLKEAEDILNNTLDKRGRAILDSWEAWQTSWHGMSIIVKSGNKECTIRIEGRTITYHNSIIGFAKNNNDGDLVQKIAPEGFNKWSFFSRSCRDSHAWFAYRHFLGWSNIHERAKLFDEVERRNNLNYIVETILHLVNECQQALNQE